MARSLLANPLKAAAHALEPPKISWRDIAILLLALVSVTLVLFDIFARQRLYDWGVFRTVVIVDLAITLVFVVEFFFKIDRGAGLLRILRDNWFEVLGMVPLIAFVALEAQISGVPFGAAFSGETQLIGGAASTGGLLRLFRFVRIVRIVQAFSRFLRATNMTFGEQVTKRFFDKYRRIIVAELTTPIMITGITISQEVIIRMKFLEAAGKSIDAKRDEIHRTVLEALERNNVPESVLTRPLVEKIMAEVEESIVNTLVDTLTGPAINELTQETIVEVLENFKEQIQSPEGKRMLKQMGAATDVDLKAAGGS